MDIHVLSSQMIAMKNLLLLFVIALVTNVAVVNAQIDEDDSFGRCLPGRNSCSECYLTLKKSLLGRDDNIRNLSLAFFPTRKSSPEFVNVTYHFGNVSTQTWFWTHASSYLLFPLRTFQYLSLGFGKLDSEVSQQVTLTLDAECNSNDTEMELLTQRVS